MLAFGQVLTIVRIEQGDIILYMWSLLYVLLRALSQAVIINNNLMLKFDYCNQSHRCNLCAVNTESPVIVMLSTGQLAGILVGCLLAVMVVVIVALVCCRFALRREYHRDSDVSNSD